MEAFATFQNASFETKDFYITKQQLKRICIGIALIGVIIAIIAFNTVYGGLKIFDDWEQSVKASVAGSIYFISQGVCVDVAMEPFTDKLYEYATDAANSATLHTVKVTMQLLGVGFGLLLMLVKLITDIQKAQDPVECLLRSISEMAISVLIIFNWDKIAGWIEDLGSSIITDLWMSDYYAPEDAMPIKPEEILIGVFGEKASGFLPWVGVQILLLFPCLMVAVTTAIFMITSYGIILEMGVRRLFMPLALADIGYEGMRSTGFRYLKKYFATYLKPVIMLTVCGVYGTVAEHIFKNYAKTGWFWSMLAVICMALATASMMTKANDWISDIVGT